MNALNEIKDINKQFKNNLIEKADVFPHTSSIISNFNSYLSKNKTLLYAMAGIALSMGIGKTFNAQDFQEQDKITHSQSVSEIIQQNNMISNKNFNENLPSLTGDIVTQLDSIKDQQAFKNPFWDNNIVTIKVDNSGMTNYGEDFSLTPEKSYEVNLQNSLYIVDSDSNYITWNKSLIDEQKEFVEHKDLFIEQIIYHEAAHAAFTQVSKFSGEHRDITQREMESDVASMLMIGVKYQSLETFNKAMDDGIKFRSYIFEQGDSEHNTLYALIELKNIINDHPELLKMPTNEIVYFANNLVTQISSKTFALDADEQAFKNNELADSFHIIDNMKNNDINYTKYLTQNFLAKKGMNSDLDSLKNMNERRLNKVAEGVKGVNQTLDHNSYSALIYFKEDQKFDKAIEKLSDMAKHASKVDASFINDTLKRIKLHDLDFDFSKIKTIQDKRIASEAENYIKTTTLKL